MKLGTFTMPVHPLGKNYVQSLREDREAILFADELGFDEAFCGEHVTDVCESIPSSLAFLASVAYSTKQIKLGTGTLNLPNSHPAHIAAGVAMLDHMLEGRFIMGISPGGLPSDWEIFENMEKDRNAMFVECIDHVLALWSSPPPFDLPGRFWTLKTGRFFNAEAGTGQMLKPFQQRIPEIVCTALHPNSPGLEMAAARGWHPVTGNILQENSVRNHWHQYQAGSLRGGFQPERAHWRVCRNIFVADSDRVAQEYGKGEHGPYWSYIDLLQSKLRKAGRLNIFKNNQDDPDELITTKYLMQHMVLAGTPNAVAEGLLAFHESVGGFGTLLYAMVDWMDPVLARRSMELMATKVLPQVRAALARGGATHTVPA